MNNEEELFRRLEKTAHYARSLMTNSYGKVVDVIDGCLVEISLEGNQKILKKLSKPLDNASV